MASKTASLSENHRRFLENPYVGTVTTIRPDGSPHSTVVYPWHNENDRICVRIRPERIDSSGLDG